MEHEKAVNRLSEYLDDELDRAEKDRVAGHLSSCPDCSDLLADMKAAKEIFQKTPRLDMPEGAARRLTTTIEDRLKADTAPTPIRSRTRLRKWTTHPIFISIATAAAVMILAIGIRKAPSQKDASTQMEALPEARQQLDGAKSAPEKNFQDEQTRELPATFNGKQLDELVKRGADLTANNSKDKVEAKASDEVSSTNERDAVSIATENQPVGRIWTVLGTFEGRKSWIVLFELEKTPGKYRATAVAVDNGDLLYRTK